MARLSGLNLAVLWADSAGTISIPTVRSFIEGIKHEMADYSNIEDSLRNYQYKRIVAQPQLSYVDFDGVESGVSGTALRQRLKVGSGGTLIWGAQGTASGNPRGALQCYVIFNSAPVSHDAEIERSLRFMPLAGTFIADPGTAIFP